MNVIYRPAVLQDVDRFHQFILRAYGPIRKLGIHFLAAEATKEDIVQHINGNLCYLMEDDGTIISSCSLRLPWGPNPGPEEYPHIGWLSTDPDYAGKGIGGRMLDWVEKEIVAGLLKSPAVTLGTAAEHPWLQQMYEKRGYYPLRTELLGRGHTTVFMKKDLVINHQIKVDEQYEI